MRHVVLHILFCTMWKTICKQIHVSAALSIAFKTYCENGKPLVAGPDFHVHELKVSRNSLNARTEHCVRTHENTLDEEAAGFISELPRAQKSTRHDCVHVSYTASYNLDGDQGPSAAL